ncbi:hypothetical protein D3C80_1126700 [compost metagenome]
MDEIAVPPDGITRLQRRDRGQGLDQQGVPLLGDGQYPARRDAAELVFRHVVQQRAQQYVRHRLGNGYHMEQTLPRDHVGERGPPLEGAEDGALGGVVDRILLHLGAVRGIPGIIAVEPAIEDPGEHPLVGRQQPALQRPRVGMGPQPLRGRAGRAAADPVRIDHADVGVEPPLAIALEGPEPVEEGLHRRHLLALACLHLCL